MVYIPRKTVSYTHLDVYKRQRTWNDQSETADFLNKNDNGCSNRAI